MHTRRPARSDAVCTGASLRTRNSCRAVKYSLLNATCVPALAGHRDGADGEIGMAVCRVLDLLLGRDREELQPGVGAVTEDRARDRACDVDLQAHELPLRVRAKPGPRCSRRPPRRSFPRSMMGLIAGSAASDWVPGSGANGGIARAGHHTGARAEVRWSWWSSKPASRVRRTRGRAARSSRYRTPRLRLPHRAPRCPRRGPAPSPVLPDAPLEPEQHQQTGEHGEQGIATSSTP